MGEMGLVVEKNSSILKKIQRKGRISSVGKQGPGKFGIFAIPIQGADINDSILNEVPKHHFH